MFYLHTDMTAVLRISPELDRGVDIGLPVRCDQIVKPHHPVQAGCITLHQQRPLLRDHGNAERKRIVRGQIAGVDRAVQNNVADRHQTVKNIVRNRSEKHDASHHFLAQVTMDARLQLFARMFRATRQNQQCSAGITQQNLFKIVVKQGMIFRNPQRTKIEVSGTGNSVRFTSSGLSNF